LVIRNEKRNRQALAKIALHSADVKKRVGHPPDGHEGNTLLGIPVVYNCSPHCASEWAHERQHSKDFFTNPNITLTEYESRAFEAEAKELQRRLDDLEKKKASGQTLTPAEQKEETEIKTDRLPVAESNSTPEGAREYVKNTNPGVDPNSTLVSATVAGLVQVSESIAKGRSNINNFALAKSSAETTAPTVKDEKTDPPPPPAKEVAPR
jgi:hypothetical protein